MHEYLISEKSIERKIAVLKHINHDVSQLETKSVFLDMLRENQSMPSLLTSIIEEISNKEDEIEVRRYFKRLLLKSENVDFKNRKMIEMWIDEDMPRDEEREKYPDVFVKDLNHLFSLIEKEEFLKIAAKRSDLNMPLNVYITVIFTKTVERFLSCLKSKLYHAEYVFLIAALYQFGYNFRQCVFEEQMGQEKLVALSRASKNKLDVFEKYGSYCIRKQHAWVVHFLILNLTQCVPETSGLLELPEEFAKNTIQLDPDVNRILKEKKNLKEIMASLSKLLQDEENKYLCWGYLKDELENVTIDSFVKRNVIDCCKLSEKSEKLQYLIQELDLKKKFPGKCTLQEALEITEKRFEGPYITQDIPWVIMHSIISCNTEFIEESYSADIPQWPQSEVDEEDMEGDLSVHPMDTFYAMWLCCDTFLKSFLCRKLALLKIAIPFIYYDCNQNLRCSLRGMRNIFIDDASGSIAKTCLKTVAFTRIGTTAFRSKSETINKLLREDHSPFPFFHRNCSFGDFERKLCNGTIEISWNFTKTSPPGSACKNYQEMTVLNLRGDAADYRDQLDILINISNILIIFVEFAGLENVSSLLSLLTQIVRNVIVVTNIPKSKKSEKIPSNCTMAGLKIISTNDAVGRAKNDKKLKEELSKTITEMLNNGNESVHLEDALRLLCEGEFLRCDDWNSKPPRVEKFFSCMQNILRDFKSKDVILPLQSKGLLVKWSTIHWNLKQTSPSHSYEIETNMEDKLSEIRIQQAKKCISNMELVADFITILLSQRGHAQDVQCFLSDIENILEEKLRATLPQMTHELVATYRGESGRDRVKTIQENLESANFGLVHLFRELGQIFESFGHCVNTADYYIEKTTSVAVQLLPRVVAHILILGRPFEIMNGEAVDISLKWVKAVFAELANIKGNKRVYSISVLGIQSFGKSTLLNAMFGLEFPVSSGKCTRGINLHLLPVKNPRVGFEYAFIFDTEGLRSSSKNTGRTSHDNKLATLAIGIADIVILNIKGENITCMEDTLQIVVHALMRLKQANNKIELRQSCIFVHQNVYPSGSAYKLESEIEETLSKLNRITKDIAKHEHMDYISSFNDVISLDTKHDVIYLPNLWHGVPPMAPISTAYSTEVQRVGKHVIEQCSQKFESFYNILNTFCRIESMWEGILGEDFVFSFQNIMHMKAYNLLQEQTNRLSWELEKFANEFSRKDVKTTLYMASPSDVEITESRLYSQFCSELDDLTKSKPEFLEQFLDSSDLKSEMIQWKESKLRGIVETSKVLKTEFKRKLSRQVFHHKIKWKYNDKDMEKNLLQAIANNAKRLQDENLSEDEKELRFDGIWRLLLNEHSSDVPLETYKANRKQLRDGILNVLDEAFEERTHLLKKMIESESVDSYPEHKDINITISEHEILDEHINLKDRGMWKRIFTTNPLPKCKLIALTETRHMFKEIEIYFNQLEDDWEYDEKDFKSEVLSKLLERITNYNKDQKIFSLTPEYQIKFAIKAAQISFRRYSILNKQFEDTHNPRAFMISKKEQAKQVFQNILLRKQETAIVSKYICNELKLQIKENVECSVSELLKDRILEHFTFLKRNLINALLKDLALSENFDTFVSYIEDPEGYAKQWMKEKALNMLSSEGDDSCEIYVRRLNVDVLSKEISFIMEVANHVNNNGQINTIVHWVQTFQDNLFGYELDTGCTSLISNDSLDDKTSFYSVLTKQIMDVEQELQNEYSNKAEMDTILGRKDPFLSVFNILWGCNEHCPLCFEPCENTTKDHFRVDQISHSCVQHRPFGIKGFHSVQSKKLSIENCNCLVNHNGRVQCGQWCQCSEDECDVYHPLQDYQKWIPEWTIPPKDTSASRYWCWFTAKFCAQLTAYYGTQSPEIPYRWKRISRSDAIESLYTPECNDEDSGKRISRSIWDRMKALFS